MSLSIIDFLRADGSIIINKKLAHAVGIDAAIMYSEIISKQKYFEDRGQLTEDGFFFNTVEDMEKDTMLSRDRQLRALKKLMKLNLIYQSNRGLPRKRCFKVNEEIMIEGINEEQLMDSLHPGRKRINERPKHKIRRGYVYFIKADNGLIKIGKTIDIKRRLDHFTAKLPYKPTLVHVIEAYDYTSLEMELHEKYKHLRKRGEWFNLTDKDLQEIINKYGNKHTA